MTIFRYVHFWFIIYVNFIEIKAMKLWESLVSNNEVFRHIINHQITQNYDLSKRQINPILTLVASLFFWLNVGRSFKTLFTTYLWMGPPTATCALSRKSQRQLPRVRPAQAFKFRVSCPWSTLSPSKKRTPRSRPTHCRLAECLILLVRVVPLLPGVSGQVDPPNDSYCRLVGRQLACVCLTRKPHVTRIVARKPSQTRVSVNLTVVKLDRPSANLRVGSHGSITLGASSKL